MMKPIFFSRLDHWIVQVDQTLKLFSKPKSTRPYPAENIHENFLTATQKKQVISLMRVNHTGEVCAQALYQAQQLTARNPHLKDTFKKAQQEEIDHLNWCYQRLEELDGRTSYLNPLWYTGAFSMGAFFGLMGDQWNLGFLKETEIQVTAHLNEHLEKIPFSDNRSTAILQQMRDEENEHADTAEKKGAKPLPLPVKWVMRFASKMMTKTAYWV